MRAGADINATNNVSSGFNTTFIPLQHYNSTITFTAMKSLIFVLQKGFTPLHKSMPSCHGRGTPKVFIEHGADIHAKTKVSGFNYGLNF